MGDYECSLVLDFHKRLVFTIPIVVPITKVIANPIQNTTSFGCADIIFMILLSIDINNSYNKLKI